MDFHRTVWKCETVFYRILFSDQEFVFQQSSVAVKHAFFWEDDELTFVWQNLETIKKCLQLKGVDKVLGCAAVNLDSVREGVTEVRAWP